MWLCHHWQSADRALVQRVQRFLTLAELNVAHKYPTSAKLYLAQFDRFKPMQPVSRTHSVQFNEEERLRYPALREEVDLLVAELANRCQK